jgi:SAM-dependent methyltransferase
MHKSVISFVEDVVKNYQLNNKTVLDVGSYDINGSVKSAFLDAGCAYTGVDMQAGPGVDIVMNSHSLGFNDESFDVVVSCEMLEHDAEFWVALKEMGRVLKAGGTLIVTARGNGFQYHPYPKDYWRFMPESADIWAQLAGVKLLISANDPQASGLFFVGVKT